MTTHQMLTNKK